MVNAYFQNEVVYLIVRHLETDPGKGYIDNVSTSRHEPTRDG